LIAKRKVSCLAQRCHYAGSKRISTVFVEKQDVISTNGRHFGTFDLRISRAGEAVAQLSVAIVKYLAMIAAWVGEKDLACEQLAIAVRSPGDLSYGQLKLMPFCDPLRGDPRFETIVASLAQSNSVAQLYVPVSKIHKMLPEVVLRSSERNLHKRPPLRSLRFADQAHVCFARKPVTLARIARDAGANHVLPSRRPAPVARHDMIEVEIAPIEQLAAVLAGVLISLKYVVPGEFYFLLWKPIKNEKHDHPRDPDFKRDSRYNFMIGRVRGQVAPAFEIVRRKVVRVIRRNNLRVPCIYERKGTPSRADVHGLPEPVEYQNLTVQ
jgi:hypothetical protein